ncbi:flagellar hook assembly protein FlgD [Massilia psychrophila]|uniref:Basal-body rod modification protein FlgD n=1 Tax=Massilia psychrophila TaxID=1603353 RepID=A0A2G8SX35_9BURK|nr:flagellar hook assembly protein FlgD [Massilia psychrophila]PIL38355.1 flagellar biosynthesis protein FlgD [Massilia psychrophila]GGE84663.1 basal-body rod modification protein FlgD [Massilia psychrophila]
MSSVNSAPAFVSQDLLATVNPKKAASVDGSVDADTNKFMTLLVTQLKNQDPMNPLDNAQLTSQLAQLSTVTGVNKLNTTLESLKASYQSSEALQATNLIGHGVLVEGNFAQLSGGKAIMGVELASAADNVQVTISDPRTGKDVHTIELGPHAAGTIPLPWDGIVDPSKVNPDGTGVALKDGKYTIRVVATKGGETQTDAKTLSFDSVASVTTSAKDGVKLNLPTKGIVSMADIKQIL